MIEQAATAEDRNVPDLLLWAAKARMVPQCTVPQYLTCGRSDVAGSLSPTSSLVLDDSLTDVRSEEWRSLRFCEHGLPVARREDYSTQLQTAAEVPLAVALHPPLGRVSGNGAKWDLHQSAPMSVAPRRRRQERPERRAEPCADQPR